MVTGTEIQAIETRYNGYRFRSRLEARWAVFFDTAGVRYTYEAEGFYLDNGLLYLPDFWLPEQDCWVEIKGDTPTPEEEAKAQGLATGTNKRVYICWGDVWLPFYDAWRDDTIRAYFPNGMQDNYYAWCICPKCEAAGITFQGRADYLPCRCMVLKCRTPDDPRLLAAYTAAREARFEG
jgi:hypothetical protein